VRHHHPRSEPGRDGEDEDQVAIARGCRSPRGSVDDGPTTDPDQFTPFDTTTHGLGLPPPVLETVGPDDVGQMFDHI
jgi:hypothetical protein